ncbi:hypothetical protein F5884DRAFT_868338 [Xylogone sp. PMI_703]|nr:hypothetical protein F5884DRAFT_868338 [Xylogone sp. PMI_703]
MDLKWPNLQTPSHGSDKLYNAEEAQPFISGEDSTTSNTRGEYSIILRVFGLLFLIPLLFLSGLTIVNFTRTFKFGTYETGFVTDFGPARALLQSEQRRFTGSIVFNADGKPYMMVNDPNERQYVGRPSPEIDSAWHTILDGYHIIVSDGEQKRMYESGGIYRSKEGYQVGFAMFHALHCVNVIRMYLDQDYYTDVFAKWAKLDLRLHIDHCLDYIRQSIQCHGDLTPVPMRWWEAANRVYSDTASLHTCRPFQDIRDWITERHNGSLAVTKLTDNEF